MIGAVRGRDVRIAFGSVAPTVVLARKTAAVLSAGGSVADAQAALLYRDRADRRCEIDK